jgi:hypothetical protein
MMMNHHVRIIYDCSYLQQELSTLLADYISPQIMPQVLQLQITS